MASRSSSRCPPGASQTPPATVRLGSGPINFDLVVIQRLRLETSRMSLFLLSARQMARIAPHFPLAHGVPRVDDRRVIGGIVDIIRHGLQWKDAPQEYGPHKTLYKRFI